MALVLVAVFGPPLRLLPLLIALGAAGFAFGLLSLLGGTLTMASVAVLPVVIGLAVDYAIQLQARFREAAASGERPPAAAVIAAVRGGPVIGDGGPRDRRSASSRSSSRRSRWSASSRSRSSRGSSPRSRSR